MVDHGFLKTSGFYVLQLLFTVYLIAFKPHKENALQLINNVFLLILTCLIATMFVDPAQDVDVTYMSGIVATGCLFLAISLNLLVVIFLLLKTIIN